MISKRKLILQKKNWKNIKKETSGPPKRLPLENGGKQNERIRSVQCITSEKRCGAQLGIVQDQSAAIAEHTTHFSHKYLYMYTSRNTWRERERERPLGWRTVEGFLEDFPVAWVSSSIGESSGVCVRARVWERDSVGKVKNFFLKP